MKMYGTPWLDATLGHPESLANFLTQVDGNAIAAPARAPAATRVPVVSNCDTGSSLVDPKPAALPAPDIAPLLYVADHVFRNASSEDVKPEVILPPVSSSPFDEPVI
jgi:hypothetical protein